MRGGDGRISASLPARGVGHLGRRAPRRCHLLLNQTKNDATDRGRAKETEIDFCPTLVKEGSKNR